MLFHHGLVLLVLEHSFMQHFAHQSRDAGLPLCRPYPNPLGHFFFQCDSYIFHGTKIVYHEILVNAFGQHASIRLATPPVARGPAIISQAIIAIAVTRLKRRKLGRISGCFGSFFSLLQGVATGGQGKASRASRGHDEAIRRPWTPDSAISPWAISPRRQKVSIRFEDIAPTWASSKIDMIRRISYL